MINMGLYRRFYRQERRSFAGAGDGAICGEATFLTSSSIQPKDTEERRSLSLLGVIFCSNLACGASETQVTQVTRSTALEPDPLLTSTAPAAHMASA